MSLALLAKTAAIVALSSAATAAPIGFASPFSAAPVDDTELAASYGKAGPSLKGQFRLSDELSVLSLRQTASVGSVLKDLWLIDFASPLIASNVRAIR